MNTHISYKTAKALKMFLGDKAPEPMDSMVWAPSKKTFTIMDGREFYRDADYVFPAYQLHDLLSKPFCEAMAKIYGNNVKPLQILRCHVIEETGRDIRNLLSMAYYNGGLSAVEKALMEMMEGK
jgi:hypothetical protein